LAAASPGMSFARTGAPKRSPPSVTATKTSAPASLDAIHAAARRRPSDASVTCAFDRPSTESSTGGAAQGPGFAQPASRPAVITTALSRPTIIRLCSFVSFASFVSSESEPHAELEAARIADRRRRAEIWHRVRRVRTRPEVALHRDHIHPVGQIEAFDERL